MWRSEMNATSIVTRLTRCGTSSGVSARASEERGSESKKGSSPKSAPGPNTAATDSRPSRARTAIAMRPVCTTKSRVAISPAWQMYSPRR